MAWKNKIHQKLLAQMEGSLRQIQTVGIVSREPFSCRRQGKQDLAGMPFVQPWATDLCTFVVESLDLWEGSHDWRSFPPPYVEMVWWSRDQFPLGTDHDDDCESSPPYVDDTPWLPKWIRYSFDDFVVVPYLYFLYLMAAALIPDILCIWDCDGWSLAPS
jgi:hypothetical protein